MGKLGKRDIAFQHGALLKWRYEVKKILAIGGVGEIYTANDMAESREVIVKTPWIERAREKHILQLFENEKKALERLSSAPDVVDLLDSGISLGAPFLVLEHLGFRNLHYEHTADPMEVMLLFCKICDALEHVHDAGIVHRDVKPDNIFIVENGIKLIDFQYSKVPGLVDYALSACHPVGSAEFMAPEQTYHSPAKDVDPRADIYAFGVSMYMLAGRKYSWYEANPMPYIIDNGLEWPDFVDACIQQHRRGKPVPLHPRFERAPPRLSEIIGKTLQKDPDKRYQSVAELKKDLVDFMIDRL